MTEVSSTSLPVFWSLWSHFSLTDWLLICDVMTWCGRFDGHLSPDQVGQICEVEYVREVRRGLKQQGGNNQK